MVLQKTKNIIKIKSFSKVNFALWIKEKRTDNYHEIETILFENENLFDEVQIEFTEDKNLSVKTSFLQKEFNALINERENLAYKAAELFFQKIGVSGTCNILIDKKIPVFSGLGGGSSNAAAVLHALNQLFDHQLHKSELLILAEKLGADVPFFILGKTSLAKGKGELLQELENKLSLEIKVVKPENVSVSTKWAYEHFDARKIKREHKAEINNLIKAMRTNDYDLLFSNLFNDFEDVIFSSYPELNQIKNSLLSKGFDAALLCGSGSAVCGIKKKK